MFSCGEEEITEAVGMSLRRSQLAPSFEQIRQAGLNFKHNLGTAACRDDTAKKNREDENEEEKEWGGGAMKHCT